MYEKQKIRVMRTKIFFTSIILIAMTAVSFGMEQRKADLERDLVTEDWMKAPFMVENEMGLETWMVTPFDEGLQEEALWLENWMTVPFGNESGEEITLENWMTEPFELMDNQEDNLECWMLTPFEISEVSASL